MTPGDRGATVEPDHGDAPAPSDTVTGRIWSFAAVQSGSGGLGFTAFKTRPISATLAPLQAWFCKTYEILRKSDRCQGSVRFAACAYAVLTRYRVVNYCRRDMSTARSYESPLRAEQMEQTRQRILKALADVLADEAVDEVTVPIVALRGQVSVRTVYRHFPTKEALFDAFGEWAEEHLRLVLHSYPETLEGVRAMAPALYRMYDERAPLIRALLSKRGQEIRSRTRRRRLKTFEKAMQEVTQELEHAERRRVLAVIYLLVSAPAWQAMRDQWGLDGEEAGKGAAWAVRILTDELRRNPASIKRRADDGHRR